MNHADDSMIPLESLTIADRRHGRNLAEAERDSVEPCSTDEQTPKRQKWIRWLEVVGSLSAWYFFGIVAIVTSKIIVQEWKCPPLVLTVQQMILGNTLLRIVLSSRSAIQPWPWESLQQQISSERIENELLLDKIRRYLPWLGNPTFVMVGVCNAFDFLCSNFAFSMSAAHFVETIKASDPITTSAIAVLGKVDRLRATEAGSLLILVVGVVLSTMGNASEEGSTNHDTGVDNEKLMESIQTASLVLLANLCFGMRALFQKRYRSSTNNQLNDVNLLFRMMQIGATFLVVPVFVFYANLLRSAVLLQPRNLQTSYMALAAANSMSYVIYNLASCYVLSKMSVLQHSSLNCLRRLILIVATSLIFRKPFTSVAIAGLFTSFAGFSLFQYFRSKKSSPKKEKDSNV